MLKFIWWVLIIRRAEQRILDNVNCLIRLIKSGVPQGSTFGHIFVLMTYLLHKEHKSKVNIFQLKLLVQSDVILFHSASATRWQTLLKNSLILNLNEKKSLLFGCHDYKNVAKDNWQTLFSWIMNHTHLTNYIYNYIFGEKYDIFCVIFNKFLFYLFICFNCGGEGGGTNVSPLFPPPMVEVVFYEK